MRRAAEVRPPLSRLAGRSESSHGPPVLDAHRLCSGVEVEVDFVAGRKLFERGTFDEVMDVRVVDTATGALHRADSAASAAARELHVECTVEIIEALCGAPRD